MGFSVQERVLARAMLFGDNRATLNYSLVSGSLRKRINDGFSDTDLVNLEKKFADNPGKTLIPALESLSVIVNDNNLSTEERRSRINRYAGAYFGLIVKLDRSIYESCLDEVMRGIPNYVPDGLSDMGSDPSLFDTGRRRERIRVDKEEVFERMKDFFVGLFLSGEMKRPDDSGTKERLSKLTASYVYKNMPYGNDDEDLLGKTIPLSHKLEMRSGVCRHQAMAAQVMMQALGLDVRLMKNNVSFNGSTPEPHVSNLVIIGRDNYILDVTNPERTRKGDLAVFMRKVTSGRIDLNQEKYRWKLKDRGGIVRVYETRNNMYYRIRDNRKV